MDRIRGRRLQRIRAEHFSLFPLCVHCEAQGRIRLATELDHIKSLDDGGLDFDLDGGTNRQGLCARCHKSKTDRDMGYDDQIQRPGGDASGKPVDPDHPWNQTRPTRRGGVK